MLVMMMVVPAIRMPDSDAKAKAPSLSTTYKVIKKGSGFTLTIKANKTKIRKTTWSCSDSDTVVLSEKKNTSVKITTGVSLFGEVNVTATVKYKSGKKTGTKKLTCYVVVSPKDSSTFNSELSCFSVTHQNALAPMMAPDRLDETTMDPVWDHNVEMAAGIYPVFGGNVDTNSEIIPEKVVLSSDKKTLSVFVDPGKLIRGVQYLIITGAFNYEDGTSIELAEELLHFATVKEMKVAVDGSQISYQSDGNLIMVDFNQPVVNIVKYDKTFSEGEVIYDGLWKANASKVAKVVSVTGTEYKVAEVSAYKKNTNYITVKMEEPLPVGEYTVEMMGFAPADNPSKSNSSQAVLTIK